MAHTRNVPVRDPVRTHSSGYGGCPVCGERRTTQDIYGGTWTYVCGYSGSGSYATTACQGKHFEQFIERPEESIWEGIW